MKMTINGREVSCPGGVTYLSLLKELGLEKGALGVSHRGATLSLNAQAEGGAEVRVLTLQDEEGRRIYERTLQFLLLAAARRALGPETRVRIEHSLGDGLYAYVPNQTLTSSQVRSIREAMQSLVAQDAPITRFASTKAEAAEYFRSLGQNDKVRLLQYRPYEHFTFYELDGMREYFYGEMAPSAGFVSVHDLILYYPGMVLMMPDRQDPSRPAKFRDLPKLVHTFAESARWNRILGCENVADLNEMMDNGSIREFIRVNEALQERSVS